MCVHFPSTKKILDRYIFCNSVHRPVKLNSLSAGMTWISHDDHLSLYFFLLSKKLCARGARLSVFLFFWRAVLSLCVSVCVAESLPITLFTLSSYPWTSLFSWRIHFCTHQHQTKSFFPSFPPELICQIWGHRNSLVRWKKRRRMWWILSFFVCFLSFSKCVFTIKNYGNWNTSPFFSHRGN